MKEDDLDYEVSKAEVLLAAYVAEHGIPFRQVDHLVETMDKCFPTVKWCVIWKQRTKILHLMQDSIALLWVAKVCSEDWFPLIIDKCTNASVSKELAVMVRQSYRRTIGYY